MQYAYANNLLKLCKYLQTKLYYLSSSLMMLLTYKCNSNSGFTKKNYMITYFVNQCDFLDLKMNMPIIFAVHFVKRFCHITFCTITKN